MAPSTTFIGTRQPLVDKEGMADIGFLKKLQEWDTKLNQTITLLGTIDARTKIQGRTEGIGTTTSQLTNAGQLTNSDQVAADGAVYGRNTVMVGSSVVVDNGNFESSSVILPPPGWNRYSDPAIVLSYDTATPYSGSQSLLITTGSIATAGIISARKYFARPGDVFRISSQAKLNSGAGPSIIALTFRNSAGTALLDATASTVSASFTFISGSAIAPAGTVYATIECYLGSTFAIGEFDEIHIARMQTAFEVTPINTAGTPTNTSATCSQVGVTTAINVSATTWQFGDGQVNYNSGSVDPGSFGTYYIYADDPGFAGGAVTYVATTTPANANAANGRLFFGKITTTGGGGGASTGGGSGGGGPVSKAALS